MGSIEIGGSIMKTVPALHWIPIAALLLGGCSERPAEVDLPQSAPEAAATAEVQTEHPVSYSEEREACANYTPLRQPLFGDVHVHTSFSFDAAANTIGSTPIEAHRFARGEAIPFWPLDADGKAAGTFKIDRPLDFLAVTDHGEFLGERALCRDPESPRYDTAFCQGTRVSERQGMMMLAAVITTETPSRIPEVCGEDGQLCRDYAMPPWRKIIEAAEEAYDRSENCEFTSFVAYEYTGTPGTSNYHRNVIFKNGNVPALPVSYIDAPIDSKLWAGLDEVCKEGDGCDYITIPHNSNLANGRMAPYMAIERTEESKRAYAEKRLQREPIIEIFQHKGGSECVNGLSSVLGAPDELCDVEAVRVIGRNETYITAAMGEAGLTTGQASEVTGECGDETGSNGMLGAGCIGDTDFVRSGLLVGLKEEGEIGLNPMKLGIIASTDTHAATPGAVAEDDWRGAVSGEATPQQRLQPGLLTSGIDGNPGGLAGVWAVENSREAIFEAMKRREVFGTSGPRIVPRFFGGWSYAEDLCQSADWVEQAYRDGAPMGGDLADAPAGTVPVFVAYAARDAGEGSAPLQQLQIIKGWIDADEKMHSEVLPVAGTPDNGAGVDVATGKRFGDGHDTLCVVYRDESFDPTLSAYYYLRAVENPSARWSVHDCLRIEASERPAVCSDGSYPATIQEMAWTSPIWYRPN
jgi:hypothetical protein